jgi:hypothetical protein
MNEFLITAETKASLLMNTEKKISEISKAVDQAHQFLEKTEKIQSLLTEKNIDINFININHLLKYRLFIGIIILDLAAAIRIYLNAKLQYEALFSVRQIIVIINEGYKKIYNFILKHDKGIDIEKYRKNSFWVKNIGEIIYLDLPDLQQEYDSITIELERYLIMNFDGIKDQRNLSIHYDENPVRVYDMLLKLDIEETFKKLIPFLGILNRMFDLTHLLVLRYNEKLDTERRNQETQFEIMISKLEEFKNQENENNISLLQDSMRNTMREFFKNANSND